MTFSFLFFKTKENRIEFLKKRISLDFTYYRRKFSELFSRHFFLYSLLCKCLCYFVGGKKKKERKKLVSWAANSCQKSFFDWLKWNICFIYFRFTSHFTIIINFISCFRLLRLLIFKGFVHLLCWSHLIKDSLKQLKWNYKVYMNQLSSFSLFLHYINETI